MIQQWKNVLIKQESTIREALEIINREALRIALVVNDRNTLLGVVTDGDIRRALLKNLSLDTAIHHTMNSSPVVASKNVSRAKLLQMMQEKSIIAVPIVDESNGLVGLETWNNPSEHRVHENPVFIMAGGFGTRLRPLTDNCPKPMLKVGDKPILERLLNQFLAVGFKNIYISTHFMPEQITRYFGDGSAWGANIHYIHEEIPLGTGGALGLLPDNVPHLPLIMINGDVLTTADFEQLLNFHNKYQPIATMCVREYNYQIPYGVINGDGHRIIEMQEKPIQHYFVNAGIYVISPELFTNVPANQHIDMPTLLEKQIAAKKDVIMFPLHEYWLDIGRMDDFNKAQLDIKGLK